VKVPHFFKQMDFWIILLLSVYRIKGVATAAGAEAKSRSPQERQILGNKEKGSVN